MKNIKTIKTDKPVFAIILSVVHSVHDLKLCLSSLEKINYPKENFKVILIDIGVVPGLRAFFRKNLSHYELQMDELRPPIIPTKGPKWLNQFMVNEAKNYAIQNVPAEYYIFTEDDCTYERDWLTRYEAGLRKDNVGVLSGPDILPEGMDLFTETLDCLLNSYMGTAGLRKGNPAIENKELISKENMAVPSRVFNEISGFSEERSVGGLIEFIGRVRNAGYKVDFLPENFVWHRRVTRFPNFVRITHYFAFDKVLALRESKRFFKSFHFIALVLCFLFLTLGIFSFIHQAFFVLFLIVVAGYIFALLGTAISSGFRKQRFMIAICLIPLMPIHHVSLVLGILKGIMNKAGSK